MSYRLSKSRVTEYLQCPKRLYLSIHHPELKEESADMQSRFDAGHQVGELARRLYPDGIVIGDENNMDLRAALEQTKQVLSDFPDKPVFEATFQHGDMLIRSDLLIPDQGAYRMVEVKSSTGVRDYHLPDCAMQSWVIENSGTLLSIVSLMHLDNSFVYKQAWDYRGLLIEKDITESVQPFKQNVQKWIAESQQLLEGGLPDIKIGTQCSQPFDCPFYAHCSADQPEYPVTLLPGNMGSRGAADMLKAKGYEDLTQVPEGEVDSPSLERIRRITASGIAELDVGAKAAIQGLPYPRYYLDFETIQFPIPIWLGTSPYRQLPFQWSCHIESADGSLNHAEFLDVSGKPPMRQFAERMIDALGDDGPILVYNQGFEKSRIRELAEMFSEVAKQLKGFCDQKNVIYELDQGLLLEICKRRFIPLDDEGFDDNLEDVHLKKIADNFINTADKLHAINERIVDLLPIAKQYYYHPAMKGSWSIKAVLPTIAPELDYSELEVVQDGGMAQTAYLEAISQETPPERKEVLRHALLKYCERDTLAMVVLADFFAGKAGRRYI